MENFSETPLNPDAIQLDATQAALADLAPPSQALTPSRRAELWSGRFAMLGFVTAMAAIAVRATS